MWTVADDAAVYLSVATRKRVLAFFSGLFLPLFFSGTNLMMLIALLTAGSVMTIRRKAPVKTKFISLCWCVVVATCVQIPRIMFLKVVVDELVVCTAEFTTPFHPLTTFLL